MKKITLSALILSMAFNATMVSAEVLPSKGHYDSRIRNVSYNPVDVVKIPTTYGVATTIQFSRGENVVNIALGDQDAWKVNDSGNFLFIKPTAENADTNLTVVTNERVYHFALVVRPLKENGKGWNSPELVYSLNFNYPDVIKSQSKSQIDRANVSKALDNPNITRNYDYSARGDKAITPTRAYDDGRFIYLEFASNKDMPAVFEVIQEGSVNSESLVNSHVEGNKIIVQRMVQKLVLRDGKKAAEVLNNSYKTNSGKDNKTGTISDEVVRVIK